MRESKLFLRKGISAQLSFPSRPEKRSGETTFKTCQNKSFLSSAGRHSEVGLRVARCCTYFHTKNPKLGKFERGLAMENVSIFHDIWSHFTAFLYRYVMPIWYMYFVVVWHIFPPFWYVAPRTIWQPWSVFNYIYYTRIHTITVQIKLKRRALECL
jgi:hypothetical protein